MAAREQSPRGLGGLPECGLRTAVTESVKGKRVCRPPANMNASAASSGGRRSRLEKSIYYKL